MTTFSSDLTASDKGFKVFTEALKTLSSGKIEDIKFLGAINSFDSNGVSYEFLVKTESHKILWRVSES